MFFFALLPRLVNLFLRHRGDKKDEGAREREGANESSKTSKQTHTPPISPTYDMTLRTSQLKWAR